MSKIQRPQQSFDLELLESGRYRCYSTESSEDGKPIYRELILSLKDRNVDRTPWWKKQKKKSKKTN